MAEEWTVTNPPVPVTPNGWQVWQRREVYEPGPPSASSYWITFRAKTNKSSVIEYRVVDREANAYGPGTAANLATARLKAANTLNFTTNSQQKRYLQFASTD